MAKTDDTSLPVVAPEPPPAPVKVTRQMMQAYPVIGHIFPITTPAGVVMHRVEKSSGHRVVSVPLTRAESQKLIAGLQAGQKEQAMTPAASWWRRFWSRS